MTQALALRFAEPELAHAEGLAALFEAASSPCFCRYWHFAGDKNAWLERCALNPQENQDELRQALASQNDEARGVIALVDDAVVGWVKVTPQASLRKLYDQRLYRKLPCFEGDREGVFAIGCVLVRPALRRHAVARALVAEVVRRAPGWGAKALEAFPRRPKERVSDEELWTGPASIFFAAGFSVVNEFEPYPVLRRLV